MTIDKQKLRELAQWKIDVHGESETLLTGERANASLQWSRAANPQTVLSLLDENEALLAERDALKRDGDALVREFHELSRTLNDIGWPSENVSGVARACRALRTLAEVRDSARAECERLRKLVGEACDIAINLRDGVPETRSIAAIRKAAES